MKKKLFIGLLPALMVLSACNGVGPQNESIFLEDTLAHEELFDESVSLKSARNLNPTDPTAPAIGIQYKEEKDDKDVVQYVSVRYVAAVKIVDSSKASASWTRTIYDEDGVEYKAESSIEITKKYTTIYDGLETLSISDYNTSHSTDYTHFVMYALRKIPLAYFGSALCASLTFDDGKNDPITTKIVTTRLATTADSVQVALDSNDFDRDGYFLKGSLYGAPSAGVAEDTATKKGVASFSTSLVLKESDSFAVAWNNPDAASNEARFKLLNPSLDGTKTDSDISKSGGRFIVGADKQYGFYLTDTGTLQSEQLRDVFFSIKANDAGQDMYVTGAFNTWSDNHPAYLLEETSSSLYEKTISVPVVQQDYKFTYNNGTQQKENSINNRGLDAGTSNVVLDTFYFNDNQYELYPPLGKDVELYVTDNKSWGAVWVYAWKEGGTAKNANYPGIQLVADHVNSDKNTVYRYDHFDATVYDRIIINKGDNSNSKTVNINISGIGRNGFYMTNWNDTYNVWNYALWNYKPAA